MIDRAALITTSNDLIPTTILHQWFHNLLRLIVLSYLIQRVVKLQFKSKGASLSGLIIMVISLEISLSLLSRLDKSNPNQ